MILFNAVVTFFINLTTLELIKCETTAVRIIIASVLGGIASLLIVLPETYDLFLIFIKLLINSVIIFILLGKTDAKKYFKGLACSFLVTMLFGGVVFFISMTIQEKRILYNNGYMYFDIGITGIIVIIIFAYILLHILNGKFNKKGIQELIYNIEIKYKNKSVNLKAFFDTGNNIIDIYTGKPVILVNISELNEFFDRSILEKISLINDGNLHLLIPENFRFLPVKTLTAEKLIPAFTAESVTVSNEGCKKIIKNPTVAITNNSFDKNNYTSLISKSVLGEYLI